MTDLSYNNFQIKSDEAIEKSIGQFIRETRQRQNKTQAEVSKEANISRSTLSLLERGETGTLQTLIQVLRVLKQLHVFSHFEIKQQVSPIALAKMAQRKRERVRKKDNPSASKKSSW